MKQYLLGMAMATFLAILPINGQGLSEKASQFLESLSPDVRASAQFELSDGERFNMNYVPIDRKGPTFHDFGETQKALALDLLRSSLSQEGYDKTLEIMELEKVLFELEKAPRRDHLNYHFCVFGNPSDSEFWGWRFEGHHISLNFSSSDGKIVSSTPTFFGTNPAQVRSTAWKGKEVLKMETVLGFELINSLEPEQLKKALISAEAPYEIFTSNIREVVPLKPTGISYSSLKADQRELFMKLLERYITHYEKDFAADFRKKIKDSGLEHLTFAWAGSLKANDGGNYYRIQGPSIILEYDNFQNDANHIHTAVRDLSNDYGEDVLKKHYTEHHNNR